MVFAKTTTLFKLTANTYATSYHGDNFFDDTYVGKVSVRGLDRFYTGSGGYIAYPTYSRVTYDVQGNISQKQVNPNGKTDSNIRTASITVKDKWNIGSKTKVYGKYGEGWVSNGQPSRKAIQNNMKHE